MQLLFVISYSPHKYFSVAPFTLGLKEKRGDYERTIVYRVIVPLCTYTSKNNWDHIFLNLKMHLTYRGLDWLTCSVAAQSLESFTSLSSSLRVVIATVAFGMGIDCPNVLI